MGNAYEIYALRYATMSARTPHMNFLLPDPHDSAAQDLDYFVWLIRGQGRDILVDTGFNAEEAKIRARRLTLNPVDALAGFGVRAEDIKDIIVTHLHYDHAGNLDRFPNARFHLQDREMAYATGRCMCTGLLRHPFSVEHVTQMVRHVADIVDDRKRAPALQIGVVMRGVGGQHDGPARGLDAHDLQAGGMAADAMHGHPRRDLAVTGVKGDTLAIDVAYHLRDMFH